MRYEGPYMPFGGYPWHQEQKRVLRSKDGQCDLKPESSPRPYFPVSDSEATMGASGDIVVAGVLAMECVDRCFTWNWVS